jgi:argininosuccinate lyase
MGEPDFRRVTSAENFVAVRNCIGGPAPEALAQALSHYGEELSAIGAAQRVRVDRIHSAARSLDTAFTSILET